MRSRSPRWSVSFEDDYRDISGLSCGGLRIWLRQPGPAQACTLSFSDGETANIELTFELPRAQIVWTPSSDADDEIAERHSTKGRRQRGP